MMVGLSELGDRICIMGPSNSGKSTLADAIARKRGTRATHLDLLYHLPGTDWEPRSPAEFTRLHDAAILGSQWVMDGNYSSLLPQRLARATGFILLDVSTVRSLARYVRRSLVRDGRVGALEGAKDRVRWEMIRHIAVATRTNRRRYAEMERTIELPKVFLGSARQIAACYAAWGLDR